MKNALYLCYCVSNSSYDMRTREELYGMIKEAAENGTLEECENTLIEVFGISIPDDDDDE